MEKSLWIVVCSSLFLQLIGSSNDSKAHTSELTRRVRMALYTDRRADGEEWLRLGRDTFFKNGPFDIDSIVLPHDLVKESSCSTLGEFLDAAAEGKIDVLNKQNLYSAVHAQVILACSFYDRSKKCLSHDPAEMLRRLINNALFLTSSTDIKSIDWSNNTLDLAEVDPDYHYENLMIYFDQGYFGGAYDLATISVGLRGGESIYAYLERESKRNIRVQRVYDLLKYCMNYQSVDRVKDTYFRLRYSLGKIPDYLSHVQSRQGYSLVKVGQSTFGTGKGSSNSSGPSHIVNVPPVVRTVVVDSAHGQERASHNHPANRSSASMDTAPSLISVGATAIVGKDDRLKKEGVFTFPRMLMGTTIGLIAGYLIYIAYYKQSKKEVDRSDSKGIRGTAGISVLG